MEKQGKMEYQVQGKKVVNVALKIAGVEENIYHCNPSASDALPCKEIHNIMQA